MKAFFLTFHGFQEHNGISKKIFYQVDALRQCGVDTDLCYMDVDEDGRRKRMINHEVYEDYGKGLAGKIKKRTSYAGLVRYILDNKINFVYIRYDHNSNPFLIGFLKKLRKHGVIIFLEIPTYPYDHEFTGWAMKRDLFVEKLFRRRLMKQIHRIVTFSNHDNILGISTVKISNGIDFDKIKMKEQVGNVMQTIHLIGVAEIHFWHGFDRVIRGLAEYYKKPYQTKVIFHIVGKGDTALLKQLVRENHLEDYVIFHGAQSGTNLDTLFEKADMGIASLARHRSNITCIKTLKNREYAARGIPFIYSEIDEDFENMPYIMKAPADESPIDINEILKFRKSADFKPEDIRNSIIHELSWKNQIRKVIDSVSGYKQL
jgi:glycosyltransferase involved in cell wall biosynthesis